MNETSPTPSESPGWSLTPCIREDPFHHHPGRSTGGAGHLTLDRQREHRLEPGRPNSAVVAADRDHQRLFAGRAQHRQADPRTATLQPADVTDGRRMRLEADRHTVLNTISVRNPRVYRHRVAEQHVQRVPTGTRHVTFADRSAKTTVQHTSPTRNNLAVYDLDITTHPLPATTTEHAGTTEQTIISVLRHLSTSTSSLAPSSIHRRDAPCACLMFTARQQQAGYARRTFKARICFENRRRWLPTGCAGYRGCRASSTSGGSVPSGLRCRRALG